MKMLPDVYGELLQTQEKRPGVKGLMVADQAEEGDYWELGVFLDRKRTASNHSLIFREALELCLIIVALWSACAADDVVIRCVSRCNVTGHNQPLGCAGSFAGNCLVVCKHPINTDGPAFIFELQIPLKSVLCWEYKQPRDLRLL